MKSKIVYRLNFFGCENFYADQSIRYGYKRKEEHIGYLYLSVHKHANEISHIIWDKMIILYTRPDQRKLLLKEMLHMNKLKPKINV